MTRPLTSAVLLVALVFAAAPALAYLPVEHKAVGDAAMQQALKRQAAAHPLPDSAKLKLTPSLEVWAGREGLEVGWFSFGDLVAIYGDLATSREDLASPYGKSNAAALRDIAKTGNFKAHREVSLHFMAAAGVNETHFARKAVETYAQWHARALQAASAGPGELWQALHWEALALHSYSDLFALGHMMTDRDRTMALVAQAKKESAASSALLQKGLSSAVKAELLAVKGAGDDVVARCVIGFEVNFVHNGFNHWGAQVTNLAGETFQLFGDHRLSSAPAGKRVLEAAMASSILQVFQAAQGKPPEPGQVNAALRSLPVHYKNAARSVDMIHEKAKVLEALARQRSKVVTEGGLDAGLLKKQPVPDGSVPYLARVRELCGAACR